MKNPFRYCNSSPEIIRLTVMKYVRFPLSLRQVEDLLSERGIDICHETVRFWWNRFCPMFTAEIRFESCFGPQPFQSGTPPSQLPNFQTQQISRPVAQPQRMVAIRFDQLLHKINMLVV